MNSIKKSVLVLLSAGLMITSCKKKDTPIGTPIISTTVVTNIVAEKATSGGTISSDGGAAITSSGICWSKANQSPTIADSKVEGTTSSGVFTAELTELTPSSTYYVRAYAINSAGIGYGDVVTFSTGNAGPTVMGLTAMGDAKVNATLTATYTYSDAEGDVESGTTYKWYVANDGTGAGETVIAGATARTYIVQATEQGKYIRVGVTPKAETGTLAGVEIKSPFIGGIGEATSVSFTYNGATVTYGILTSLVTGKKWLDRNLGAGNAPSALTDYANYGDLFQWGRSADGHQVLRRSAPGDANISGVNGITAVSFPYTYSSSDMPGHSKFITGDGIMPADWRMPQNNNLWQGVMGVNNPCPSGWRIPTKTELDAENIENIIDGFAKLKFTYTGVRDLDGNVSNSNDYGYYWTSTVSSTDPTQTWISLWGNTIKYMVNQPRGWGYACRCIKD